MYNDPAEYGYVYLALTPVLLIAFADTYAYWLHCACHYYPPLYKIVHKHHHSFVYTASCAGYAINAIEGFLKILPYFLFAMLFPCYTIFHDMSYLFAGVWSSTITGFTRMYGIVLRVPTKTRWLQPSLTSSSTERKGADLLRK